MWNRFYFFGVCLYGILFARLVMGQAMYNVKMEVKIIDGERAAGRGCGRGFESRLEFTNGDYLNHSTNLANGYVYSVFKVIPINYATSRVYIWEQNHDWWSGKLNEHCYGEDHDVSYYDLNSPYQRSSFSQNSYGIPEWNGSVKITFWPQNLDIIAISGPDNGRSLVQNTPLNISATPGFPSDAYVWKYQLSGNSNWVDLPSTYQNKSSISFTGQQLLGTRFNQIMNSNQKVVLGLFYRNQDGNYTRSNTINVLTPKWNAPQIQNVQVQKAKCFESTSTDLVVRLTSKIGANRKLSIILAKAPLNSSYAQIITDDSLNSNNEFIIKDLSLNSTYKIAIHDYLSMPPWVSLNANYYINTAYSTFQTYNLLPLQFQLNVLSNDVYCYGGHDASIVSQLKGGRSPYTIYVEKNGLLIDSIILKNKRLNNWKNDSSLVQKLSSGFYTIKAKDFSGCEVSASVQIKQPNSPLLMASSLTSHATGFDLSNGSFLLSLQGGTMMEDSIFYPPPILKDSSGKSYLATFVRKDADQAYFQFKDLHAGSYYYQGIDYNYKMYHSTIIDSVGCMFHDTLVIEEPRLLEVDVIQIDSILCHGASNAQCVAHVKGGVPFSVGSKLYEYIWVYSPDGKIAYTQLMGNDTLVNQKAGFYQLQVIDKNNNKVEYLFKVNEPLAISAHADIQNVNCLNQSNGAIKNLTIEGGAPPYSYAWSNGEMQVPSIQNLKSGIYSLLIQDNHGCKKNEYFKVKDTLNGISVLPYFIQSPICTGDSTGSIAINVMVDALPYRLLWNTGNTDTLITNLKAGTYHVQVWNAHDCLSEMDFTMTDPSPIPLSIDSSYTICTNQFFEKNIELHSDFYSYQWFGQDTICESSYFKTNKPGEYEVEIRNAEGCFSKKQFQIQKTNKSIQSEFVVSSQVYAGEEATLVNITPSENMDTCFWNLASNVNVIHQNKDFVSVMFPTEGLYEIEFTTRLGLCEMKQVKEVQVLAPAFRHEPQSNSLIQAFDIRPNPSNGQFKIGVNLKEVSPIKISLMNFYSNQALYTVEYNHALYYDIPLDMNLEEGSYLLLLETPQGTRVAKLIIM
jgi:hypothetical protein